jgi:hypothetical protein
MTTPHQAEDHLNAWARHQEHAYASGEDRPLGSLLAILGGYGVVTGGLFTAVRLSRRELPERLPASDLALLTVATHKIARLAAKDPVTSPLRAPFTRFDGTSGEAELAEQVRGKGPRKAMGELVTCPFWLGQWVATALAFGLVLTPRPTRLVASVFTALTGADLLQLLYAKTQTWATS